MALALLRLVQADHNDGGVGARSGELRGGNPVGGVARHGAALGVVHHKAARLHAGHHRHGREWRLAMVVGQQRAGGRRVGSHDGHGVVVAVVVVVVVVVFVVVVVVVVVVGVAAAAVGRQHVGRRCRRLRPSRCVTAPLRTQRQRFVAVQREHDTLLRGFQRQLAVCGRVHLKIAGRRYKVK